MAYIWSAVLLGLLVFTSVCKGSINITGHETPLFVGYDREIVCTWNDGNAAKMEWYLAGVNTASVVSDKNTTTIILPIEGASGLDGTRFRCRVTTFDGELFEGTVTLTVTELTNRVEIQASSDEPVAGELFTLTCIITSDVQSQVTWIGPNGQSVDGELHDETGVMSTVTFSTLHTSHGGVYTCVSHIVTLHSRIYASYSLRVHIPSPAVSITRQPLYPTPLFRNSEVMLQCIVQLIPEVDTPVTVHLQWSGHPSLYDVQRLNISEVQHVYPTYQSTVSFSSLLYNDTGSYTCTVHVSPDGSNSVIQGSLQNSDTIDIHTSLRVDIEVTYDPPLDFFLSTPPYYRPASTVTLTCRSSDAIGSVRYQWSSTCRHCFASRSNQQSITRHILTSTDAGLHTCTISDDNGNTGSNSTEMKLIGAGIYVQRGHSDPSMVSFNNSIVLSNAYCCYERVQLYCYSNSTRESNKYLIWPNGRRYQPDYSRYHSMSIYRSTSSGMYIRSYSSYHPANGIYTCQLQDSNENLLDISFGLYSSMPQSPSIRAVEYTHLMYSTDVADFAVASITCMTQNSPPTNVTWMMDGSVLDIDGQNYSVLQTVTNRITSHYNATLLIRNILSIIGTHNFTCLISNIAGSHAKSITMNYLLPASPVVDISAYSLPIISKEGAIVCTVHIASSNVFSNIVLPHLHLEWVGPNEYPVISNNTITVGEQRIVNHTIIKRLTFNPLEYAHSGLYQCRATGKLGSELYTTEANYTLIISSQALFQLKFGPFEHCSQWHHDEGISFHLERDIKSSVTAFINANSNHTFHPSAIDKGEFSCQTASSSITYRARITGSERRIKAPMLLHLIREWISRNGTFTYTYHSKMELKIDPYCSLEIESFSSPECGTGNIVITGHETPIPLGESRNILCKWHGNNATKMEWYLFGLDTISIESKMHTNSLALSSHPNSTALDGAMFTCRVTVGLEQYEETINLFVERLEKNLSIESSADSPTAGENFNVTCTVTSDKPAQLTWMGRNGFPVSGENPSVSSQVTNGMLTSVKLMFKPVHTSHAGIYTCNSLVDSNTNSKTYLIRVKIPPPRITINPEEVEHTGNPLTLTCSFQVGPAVDTPIMVNTQWIGHTSIFDDGERVIISQLEGEHPFYRSVVKFKSLKSEDAGDYICLTNISSLNESPLLLSTSSQAGTTLKIALSVFIQIEYSPPSDFNLPSPPYYRPATSVTLTCHVHGASHSVNYYWSSTSEDYPTRKYYGKTLSIGKLTSADAGVYTCTVTDNERNTGSNKTEIKLKGSGMYLDSHGYFLNNSIVIAYSGYSCYSRKLYCYSDSSWYDIGHVRAYNGRTSSSYHNYLSVSRQNPAGLLLQYRTCNNLHPGIYTCEIPDSNGQITESSIAVYSSTPSALEIESTSFSNQLTTHIDPNSSLALAEVTCNTKISPPTDVTWLRDGKKLTIDGTLYQTAVRVADRINYLYNTTLVIHDAANIGGIHNYTCIVSNTQGRDLMTITTNISVLSEVSVLPSAEPINEQNTTLKCVATPFPNLRKLLPYLTMQWITPVGAVKDSVATGLQIYSTNKTTLDIQFSPLVVSHSGVYTCRVRLNIPNSVGNYVTTRDFDLTVHKHIQLRFGPIIHCSILHRNEEMAAHLKDDISHSLASIVNEMCNCSFQRTMINQESISCHAKTSMVVYRALIAGSSTTLTTPQLIALIQQWLLNDSTFLYTYHGRIRLRADPNCPLEITSFSEPECGNVGQTGPPSIRSVPHTPSDELYVN